MRGTFPVLVAVVKDQGPLGGNLTVCWAVEMEGKSRGKSKLGMAKEIDSILHCFFFCNRLALGSDKALGFTTRSLHQRCRAQYSHPIYCVA